MTGLTIAKLQKAHVDRQEEWCPDQKPTLLFRSNELAGEVGELCNIVKKLERERLGWRGSRATMAQLEEEIGDAIHCAILVAITAGVDAERVAIDKFNKTSEDQGLSTKIGVVRTITDVATDRVEMLISRWQHRKGGTYQVIGHACVQTDAPLADYDDVTVYRSEQDHSIWVRPTAEFHDGRFAPVVSAAPTPEAQAAAPVSKFEATATTSDGSASKFETPAPCLPIAKLEGISMLPGDDTVGFQNPAGFAQKCHEAAACEDTDDADRMRPIDDLISELQGIRARFGNTCVYIRRGGVSWGAVALNRRSDDEKNGVLDMQAQHDKDMLALIDRIERLKIERNELRTALAIAEGNDNG